MTLFVLLRMANIVKKQAYVSTIRGRSTVITQFQCSSITTARCTTGRTSSNLISSRCIRTSISQLSCYHNATTSIPSICNRMSNSLSQTQKRSYVVLPSTFKDFLKLFTIDGLNKYVFGDDKANTKSKRMRLLTFSNNERKMESNGRDNDSASSSSSLSTTRSLFNTNTTGKKISMKERIRDLYNLSKASKWNNAYSSRLSSYAMVSSATNVTRSTKSMIMARRANIFLARVRRERTAMIKEFKRSIIGAAAHRRSTMARRRLTTTMNMVRRANRFLEKAADAVNQVHASTRNMMKMQDNGPLYNTYSSSQEADCTPDEKISNFLLVHPNSKFDREGFPLASHVLTTDDDINDDDDNVNNGTNATSARSRRYINPWSISACQHEPFINYLKWKWHNTFHTKDKTPKSLQDFMEKTAAYISVSNNQNIFSNVNFDNNNAANDSPAASMSSSCSNVSSDRIKCTWIGHSTCLIQMHGVTILTDPVFSDVIGPMTASYRRYVPPSHTIDELRNEVDDGIIDIVCLSHDHYDHLDYTSINDLVKSKSVQINKWCVPLGMKKWLLDNFGQQINYNGIDEKDVYEMEWWEELTFDKNHPISTTTSVKVTCAPSQHWCCRTPFDRDTRLWCSWAIETIQKQQPFVTESSNIRNRLAFYFAGDTGVPRNGFPLHKQIGIRLGPFDLTALPIGAYLPDNFIGDSHISPKEARQLHRDLCTTYSLAIHWGTFALGDEPFYEPPFLLRDCFDKSTEEGKDPFLLIRQGGYVLSDFSSPVDHTKLVEQEQEDVGKKGIKNEISDNSQSGIYKPSSNN